MTSPINPLDIINKTEPAASTSKRRSPTSLSSVDESVEIQPIKRAAVDITPKTEILKLLLAQLVDEGEEVRFNETPDCIQVSTTTHQYHIFPSEGQRKIIIGKYEELDFVTLINALSNPIELHPAASNKTVLHLSLISIFFTKNSVADKISKKIQNGPSFCDDFTTIAMTFAILPYFSDSACYLNPGYIKQTKTLLEYLKQLKTGSMLYICNAGIDPKQIEKKTGFQVPEVAVDNQIRTWINGSRQIVNSNSIPWANLKSFAQIEAEEARNIINNAPSGAISTLFLRQVAHFSQTCSTLLLIDALNYKIGPFDFESTGDIRFFDNPVTASLLNSGINPPNYDESKTFKDNLINLFTTLNPSLRQLADSLEILDDKTCLLKAGAATLKISFASEHADSELLPDFLLADTLEGISREETQPIAPTESTIPLNTFPADLLRILSWQISYTETASVVFNSSTNTYTAILPDGQKHTYSIKPCHIQALTGDLAPDEYLNAFIEPIVCNIQGVEFNFSLFSLLFSTDLARYIKTEKIDVVFFVHATNYLLTPKTHPYINRDYIHYTSTFYYNLKRLLLAKSLQKIPIDSQLYGKIIGKINSDFFVIVNVPIKFNCDFFSLQEAGLAVSNKYEKTKLTPYLEAWKGIREKNPGMRTYDEKMFLSSRNDNSTVKVELEIEKFISNNVISFLFKQNFRLLLSAFINDKDFNVSYLKFSHEPHKHIYKVSTSDNETYELHLDEHQYSALINVTNYNLLELEAFSKSIAVTLKSSHGNLSFHTSLLSLLYQRNPYSEGIVDKLRKFNNPSLAAAFNTFLTNATEFALQPFDNIINLNPDYIHIVETYYRNLCDIVGSNDYVFPCRITRSQPFYQTGSVTWKLRSCMKVTPSSIYSEEIRLMNRGAFLNTRHVQRWKNFFNHIKKFSFNEWRFEYNGSTYNFKYEPLALHPVFLEINRDNAAAPLAPRAIPTLPLNPEPAVQSAPIDPVNISTQTPNTFKDALKALLFPLVSETFEYRLKENVQQTTVVYSTRYKNYALSLNADQSQFLKGNIAWDYFGISQDLIAPIEVFEVSKDSNNSIGKTSIFAVFYNDNELTAKLVARLKICPHKLAFLAHGITFALHPIIHTGPTCNPKIIPLLTNFHRHFVEINDGSNVFPGSQHKTQIVVGGTEWNFGDTTITTQSRYYLASSEANECTAVAAISSPPILQFKTEHTALWHRFFKAVKYISSNVDSITFMNGTARTKWKGTFLSTKPEFKLIVGIPLDPEEDKAPSAAAPPPAPPVVAPLPPAPPIEAKLPPAPLVSSTPPSIPNTPAIEKLRIANVIETYWFQNPVNYSRWIKLLQKSRAVFAFDSLPNELMEPLKAFKKEHVEAVLKYLGVGVDITGNLENDLIEKAVPTLLRVKAAEFKLVKKTFGEEKERKEIEFKPCYLVKPGPRFVHVIKVIARFDEYGLLSGFLMAEGNVESNISLDAFNKLVEEGKNKRAIVLQRETIKLTEEAAQAPEISPTRKKREREEVEKKEDESAEKVAKGDPILPPVPVARPNLKRPSTENTIKPKAPKESKFNDKGDITSDKPRALGKPQDGGIIAPPEMIDQPKAPDLQQALSLDELFSALSANAGAHINHVVKISLNQLKAIFSEEPLSYEGLELITKLENTPVPNTPCLVPKAKSYQWDFVMQAKRRENAGLGSILAPYMGLGKTWIYISKIILSFYEDSKGHHLVITPKPLRKTITEDAIVILNDARLNAFVHLKSMKWGNWCADSIIKESNPREITFLLSLLGLFDEETFNKIMAGRGPITSTLVLTYVKGFHQYPSKLKRLYEHCKSIAPKSLPERGHFDEKGLERILKFSSSRIVKCEDGKDLVKHAKSDESKIIIASYEQAEHLASDPVSTPGCASITFDEAQYIHNPEIKIAKAAETLLKVLNPKAKMAVTGTPIENGIEDLFQLVGLMAPELKCPSILSTLHSLSSGASRFTKFKDREQALTHLIKFHGHMQAYLTRVSQNLVLILKKDDPRVKEAWGDGAKVEYSRENISISALAEQKYREAHELFKTRKVDEATGKKLDSNMAYYSRVASIMLDPDLKAENLTKKDPAVQRLLKWIKSEPEMAKIDELIARSAILSSIVYSPKTRKAVDEKKVELIFVANIAVGKVIRKVLKRKFPESQGTESYLMYGDQKDEKKDKIIDSLKENGKSKFGILSIESGSTGFSIPDAYVTIMQTLSYNVATELQAIGRMDRATSKGDKFVIYPRFGIFSEEHIPVVQEIKKLTFKSFFSPAATQLERLQDIAQLNRHNIYQSYLNEKRDAQEALVEMEEIDAITESLLTAIDEEELQAFVEKLTPPLPIIAPPPARIAAVAKTTLAPPLRIAGNKLFKMPLPNTLANEDKVRLAQFIQENKKALEGPLKEIYNQFKNPELRNLVRSGASMPTPESARVHQILMNLIQDAKQSVRSIDDIGIDRFKIEGQDYVLEGKSHPERIKRVKVVSSINGPFEILI